MSPDNIKHYYVQLPNDHTSEYIGRLIQIVLIKRVHSIEEDIDLLSNNFKVSISSSIPHDTYLPPTLHTIVI